MPITPLPHHPLPNEKPQGSKKKVGKTQKKSAIKMQDPLPSPSGPAILAAGQDPPLEQLKCPRCDSTNTKFCYYNNYNLSQPRHFCKNCRRYWTKGGSLRNIPIGGGSRKNSKRASASAANPNPPKRPTPDPVPASSLKPEPEPAAIYHPATDPDDKMLEISGSFSSLLQSSGQFGDLNFLDGFDSGAGSGENTNPDPQTPQREQPENFMAWAGGWPDLAIYTSPGSSFQ